MIKIDFDSIVVPGRKKGSKGRLVLHNKRVFVAQRCLNELKPCYARVSSSKRGFHIMKFCDGGLWLEQTFDDTKRRLINEIRIKEGLTANILFDVKSFRNVTRESGEWKLINDGYDVEMFLDYWRA